MRPSGIVITECTHDRLIISSLNWRSTLGLAPRICLVAGLSGVLWSLGDIGGIWWELWAVVCAALVGSTCVCRCWLSLDRRTGEGRFRKVAWSDQQNLTFMVADLDGLCVDGTSLKWSDGRTTPITASYISGSAAEELAGTVNAWLRSSPNP